MRRRVRFLSQHFMPEPAATSELLSGIAIELASAGFEVDAVAGQPSYRAGSPRLPRVIEEHGVRVRRVWSTRLDRDAWLGRVLNSFTFALSALLAAARTPPRTVLVAATSPPLLPWACLAARLAAGVRYVLVIHDVYPDVAVALGCMREGSLLTSLWRGLNRAAFARAERIVVLGRDMLDVVRRIVGGRRRPPVTVIPNWADGSAVVPRPRQGNDLLREIDAGQVTPGHRRALLDAGDRFVALYSGNIGRVHEIDTVLRAAEEMRDEPFLFVFIGAGAFAGRVREAAGRPAAGNVVLLPSQPRDRLPVTLCACDAGLVTLKAGLEGLSVPSKLYGLLAAGKPVVVVGPEECEAARVVREAGCGAVVRPGDARGLAAALRELKGSPEVAREWGLAARRAFEASYDLRRVARMWAGLLAGLPPR